MNFLIAIVDDDESYRAATSANEPKGRDVSIHIA
jgi:hypothetical protein